MNQQITVPLAKGVSLETSSDGKQSALIFKIAQEPGMLGVAIDRQELSRTASLLISQAAEVASKVTPENPPEKLSATPILASHLAFAKGRSDSEALVAFRVGNLRSNIRGRCDHAACTMHSPSFHDDKEGAGKTTVKTALLFSLEDLGCGCGDGIFSIQTSHASAHPNSTQIALGHSELRPVLWKPSLIFHGAKDL